MYNVGSGKQVVKKHCWTVAKHLEGLKTALSSAENKDKIQAAIHDFKGVILESNDGAQILGMGLTPLATQVTLAEWTEDILKAGIPPNKSDKLRSYIERAVGISLTSASHLAVNLGPLRINSTILSRMRIPVANMFAWMSDCCASNLASYQDSLAKPFCNSDHNGCMPHTGTHVGEHMEVRAPVFAVPANTEHCASVLTTPLPSSY
jgi:hypothetical protein